MIKVPLNNTLNDGFKPIVVLDFYGDRISTLGEDFHIVIESYYDSWDKMHYRILDNTSGRYIARGFKDEYEAKKAIHRFYTALKNGERFFDFGED